MSVVAQTKPKRGRGRPRKSPNGELKQRITTRLATDVVAHIKRQPNQSEFIEWLVRRNMRSKP